MHVRVIEGITLFLAGQCFSRELIPINKDMIFIRINLLYKQATYTYIILRTVLVVTCQAQVSSCHRRRVRGNDEAIEEEVRRH